MADTPYHPHNPSAQLRSPSPPPLIPLHPLPQVSVALSGDPLDIHDTHDTHDTHTRRRSLPFVFPPLPPKNTSSTFLIHSTAEGKPIPLDDSTTAHRTIALRQLSRSQPSPHRRYSGTSRPSSIQSATTGTYSQPVVVRTYSGAPPSSSARGPLSISTISPSLNPLPQHASRNGPVKSMARQRRNKKGHTTTGAKLPPLDSFTFKSIIADIQRDVGADLDRIAEICARTRYSLSNQYEVHIAPQGSEASFLGPPAPPFRQHVPVGPTLQAVSNDDEHIRSLQLKKRRNATRRRSAAYGTLETIMSSSRSSDEDKSNKKPAAEIVEEVLGHAAVDDDSKDSRDGTASANSTEAQASNERHDDRRACMPPRSALFAAAMIDTSRCQTRGTNSSFKDTAAVLLSDPAEPQTSRNYLQTKTSPDGLSMTYYVYDTPPCTSRTIASQSVTAGTVTTPGEPNRSFSLLTEFTTWITRKKATVKVKILTPEGSNDSISYAENTLKGLLKLTEP